MIVAATTDPHPPMMTTLAISQPLSPASSRPGELLFADLAHEVAATHRMLAAVPDGHDDWTPHPRSMSLGRLATHLAQLPRFVGTVLSTEELDFATAPYAPPTLATTADRVAYFDARAREMQQALDTVSWDALNATWTMRAGSELILRDRKSALIRRYGISHLAHHRAQLGVYLRLLDRRIPGVYGPSADEM